MACSGCRASTQYRNQTEAATQQRITGHPNPALHSGDIRITTVLRGKAYIDETFYKLRKEDIQTKEDEFQYRGLSRNQIRMGIGCDLSGHVFCTIEGNGKTSSKKTLEAFLHHIELGATLVQDRKKSHDSLVKELRLVSENHSSKSLKGLPDKGNPMDEINWRCRQFKQFLNSHSGFDRANPSDYLNLFAFIAILLTLRTKRLKFYSTGFSNPQFRSVTERNTQTNSLFIVGTILYKREFFNNKYYWDITLIQSIS